MLIKNLPLRAIVKIKLDNTFKVQCFQFYLHLCKWHNFVPFNGWVILNFIYVPHFFGSSKKQESSRKTSISALLTMTKPLNVWITINCGKLWNRWEYQSTWPAYRFLKRQIRWSGIPICFIIFHSLLWSTHSKALS